MGKTMGYPAIYKSIPYLGVREYWIVDPMKQQITVYNFEHDTYEEYAFSNIVKAGIYEDLEIDFAEISIE